MLYLKVIIQRQTLNQCICLFFVFANFQLKFPSPVKEGMTKIYFCQTERFFYMFCKQQINYNKTIFKTFPSPVKEGMTKIYFCQTERFLLIKITYVCYRRQSWQECQSQLKTFYSPVKERWMTKIYFLSDGEVSVN